MAKAPARLTKKAREDAAAAKAQRLEWVVGSLAGLLVVALIGMLTVSAVIDGDGLPRMRVEVAAPVQWPDQLVFPIIVHNEGAGTAADVVVEGVMGEQRSVVTLDYVGGNSRAEAALAFADAPSTGVKARILGYTAP